LKIICIVQIYNELKTGCLEDFFDYNEALFDHILIYDDCSTDGSYEYCCERSDYVTRASVNDFKSERLHKNILLQQASELNAEFVMYLDADEVLSVTRVQLENLCAQLDSRGLDGYRANFLNLWRSPNHVRTDSLFDEFKPVKLWRHRPGVEPYEMLSVGLHQQPQPDYVEKVEYNEALVVVHTGFISAERIARKFYIYRKHGQTGFELLRFIDESKLTFRMVDRALLPNNWGHDHAPPTPLSIEQYMSVVNREKLAMAKPRISIFSLVYKDVGWLQFVYDQVLKYTALEHFEFFFVANNATQEVLAYLQDNYIPHYTYAPHVDVINEHYINNVYRAYNFGAAQSKGDYVVMINSDMAFSPGWLESLIEAYSEGLCVTSRLVEQGRIATGLHGIEKDFGSHFSQYREAEFLNYVDKIRVKSSLDSGLYMPLFIKKTDFVDVGGYPEGNITFSSDVFSPKIAQVGEPVISGDTALMLKLAQRGVIHKTCLDSVVYHFQEGEKRTEGSADEDVKKRPMLGICNDIITGINGEKVLWDFLLELPRTIGLPYKVVKGKTPAAYEGFLEDHAINLKMCIQNASFMARVLPNIYTVAFLQDDLRRMNRASAKQESVISSAHALVTNSVYTASSYPEYEFEIVPVGVDDSLFKPMDQQECRLKWGIPIDKPVGIFIGALDEVKGWPEINQIIDDRPDINWIIVSKYKDEFEHKGVFSYSKMPQNGLAELINCSTFFILGSKVETQCLAAIEAALCNVPVVMRRTGIFYDMKDHDLNGVGEIGENLAEGVERCLVGLYNPRETMLRYPVTVLDSKANWWQVISQHKLIVDGLVQKGVSLVGVQESRLQKFKMDVEFFCRRKVLMSILGRDTFFSAAELSSIVKKSSPLWVFNSMRALWRLIRVAR
jgi:glycosyltransferase involved in cell wall biosynthesis